MMKNCAFCDILAKGRERVIAENSLAFAILDNYPANKGHMLIIPKRHFENYFDASPEELAAINELLHQCKSIAEDKYKSTGYNIAINVGYDAGQTVMHLHVHLIPRYKGDVEDPRGGIRRLKPRPLLVEVRE